MNRRQLLNQAATAIPILTLGIGQSWAAGQELELLEESHPLATALSYVHDAATSEKRVKPEQLTQFCVNCLHYAPTEDDLGTCAVIPGYRVAAKGWCMIWVAIPPS